MSGGSLNYLCWKEWPEICGCQQDLETVERVLIEYGYTDIARDVRRLIEYCLSAENRIDVLAEQLRDVFHAVEWYESCDYGKDELVRDLDAYRKEIRTDGK